MTGDRLSVVLVTYRSAGVIGPVLSALQRELRDGDEVIVVDNASDDDTLEVVRLGLPAAEVVVNPVNAGFPLACNLGAQRARGDVLVFLNPDATPQPGWGPAIRSPVGGDAWAAWQALVTTDSGQVVNSAGNVVHFTGVAWAGQAGTPVQMADVRAREVAYCSGACLAVRRPWFERVGGFASGYFLYHEDLDLSLRLRLAGGRLGLEPRARVEHRYEFAKGTYKWRLLERNRWATLIRDWPGSVLVAVLPALVATEVAMWVAAVTGGWGREKAVATGESLRALPAWLRERCMIERHIGAGEFARWLTPELSSVYLGRAANNELVGRLLRCYWAVVLRLLSFPRVTRSS